MSFTNNHTNYVKIVLIDWKTKSSSFIFARKIWAYPRRTGCNEYVCLKRHLSGSFNSRFYWVIECSLYRYNTHCQATPENKKQKTACKNKTKKRVGQLWNTRQGSGRCVDHTEWIPSNHTHYFGAAGMLHRFDVTACTHIPEFDARRAYAS